MHRLILFGIIGTLLLTESVFAQGRRRHGHRGHGHRGQAHIHVFQNVAPIQNYIPSHRFVPQSTARVIHYQPRYHTHSNRQIVVQSPAFVQAVPQYAPSPYYDPGMVPSGYPQAYPGTYYPPQVYHPQAAYYPPVAPHPAYGPTMIQTPSPILPGPVLGMETQIVPNATVVQPQLVPTPAIQNLPEPIDGGLPVEKNPEAANPPVETNDGNEPTTTLDIRTPPLEPVEVPATNSILNVPKDTKTKGK